MFTSAAATELVIQPRRFARMLFLNVNMLAAMRNRGSSLYSTSTMFSQPDQSSLGSLDAASCSCGLLNSRRGQASTCSSAAVADVARMKR